MKSFIKTHLKKILLLLIIIFITCIFNVCNGLRIHNIKEHFDNYGQIGKSGVSNCVCGWKGWSGTNGKNCCEIKYLTTQSIQATRPAAWNNEYSWKVISGNGDNLFCIVRDQPPNASKVPNPTNWSPKFGGRIFDVDTNTHIGETENGCKTVATIRWKAHRRDPDVKCGAVYVPPIQLPTKDGITTIAKNDLLWVKDTTNYIYMTHTTTDIKLVRKSAAGISIKPDTTKDGTNLKDLLYVWCKITKQGNKDTIIKGNLYLFFPTVYYVNNTEITNVTNGPFQGYTMNTYKDSGIFNLKKPNTQNPNVIKKIFHVRLDSGVINMLYKGGNTVLFVPGKIITKDYTTRDPIITDLGNDQIRALNTMLHGLYKKLWEMKVGTSKVMRQHGYGIEEACNNCAPSSNQCYPTNWGTAQNWSQTDWAKQQDKAFILPKGMAAMASKGVGPNACYFIPKGLKTQDLNKDWEIGRKAAGGTKLYNSSGNPVSGPCKFSSQHKACWLNIAG